MASLSNSRRLGAVLAWLVAAPSFLGAQQPATPTPLRLSFADAVRVASGQATPVELATLRATEADARVRQARSALLPSLAISGAWVNRTFNSKSLGISFPTPPGQPGLPELIGPFDNYDGRVRATQTVFDWSSVKRVRAAGAQADGTRAERGATVESAAQTAAAAYLRAARAAAVVAARRADSSIAAELVTLAEAQKRAGVSAPIDVTRARTQLVTAQGLTIIARNELDRARIALARALAIDPATPLELADTLAAGLANAEVPGDRQAAVAAALAGRPDLQAEVARGAAARQTGSAIRAERLPRLDLEADYGVNGLTMPSAISTRQVALPVTVAHLDRLHPQARIAEQNAAVSESRVRERDLRQQIAADVDGALLDLRSAEAQQVVAAERLRLATDELAQARERFKAGVAGNIEVIDAQSHPSRARGTDIDAPVAAPPAPVAPGRGGRGGR